MPKVLKVSPYEVVLGMNDGSFRTYRRSDFNYNPRVNDRVEIFENEFDTIISKVSGESRRAYNVVVNGRYVNKFLYIFLSFFFGGFGFQKFYSGKTGSGIMCLIFSWTAIPAFIGFYDGIIALFQREDERGRIFIPY